MNKYRFTLAFLMCLYLIQAQDFNGFALYNAQGEPTTYLIDENLNIAHTWNLTTECNYTVQLKENGNLVRGTKYNNNELGGAADAGRVQEIDPLGNIVWDYIYSDENHLSHHDLTLVGDNVLITAWEVKSQDQINNIGGNATSDKWPTHFIELENDGNGGANIVWEWHIWDHMIQDVDSSLPNYGIISENPQLIDVNMISFSSGGGPGGGGPGGGNNDGDWFHVNGVDYNKELDQIVFSSRFASEIYIIDHSTNIEEAASHTGGNSGMGGDIIYRWGNPSNYNVSGNQNIPNAVHDVRWITNDGRPNGGFLQIFNNSGVSNDQSTIDGIETPIDDSGYNYIREEGEAYGPELYSTRYECAYSAPGQSASDRMSNGNIFINASDGQGGDGVMYEVDADTEEIIWGPYQAQTQKAFRYECDYPGIITLAEYMLSLNSTTCFPIALNESMNVEVSIFPNPSDGMINISTQSNNLENIQVSICNILGHEIYSNTEYTNSINKKVDLLNYPNGIYIVKVLIGAKDLYSYKIEINS